MALWLVNTQTSIVAAPSTDTFKIVFTENEPLGCFDSAFYSPNLTEGRANNAEIEAVLRELYECRGDLGKQICTTIFCYIMIIFFGVFVFVMLMVTLISKYLWMLPLFIIGIIGIVCFAVYYLINGITGANSSRNLKAKAVIDKYNPIFASRGLRWHIPASFPSWVELWKDYQNGQTAIQIGQPNIANTYGANTYGGHNTAIYQPPHMHQPTDNNIYHAPTLNDAAQQEYAKTHQTYQANYYQ